MEVGILALMIRVISVLSILWSLPATFTSYIIHILQHACWHMCMKAMQLVFIFFYHAAYAETEQPRNPKSRMWKGMWKGFATLWSTLNNIGTSALDAIELSLGCDHSGPRKRLRKATQSARVRRRRLFAMSVLAMNVQATIATERYTAFDTDTAFVGIDNRCSGCISHDLSDFVGPLKPSGKVIKGFGGSRTTNVQVGTLRWTWEDDQGAKHTFTIPNSYYVPDGNVRLLSPQHWAQTQARDKRQRSHCGETTNGMECILHWENGAYQRRIPLGRHNNVATFHLAPGFTQFKVFCAEAELDDHDECDPLALPSGVITDEEPDETTETPILPPADVRHNVERSVSVSTPDQTSDAANPVDFSLNGPSNATSEGGRTPSTQVNIITDEEDRQTGSDLAELLRLHHQFGHISMRKLQEMARHSIIPKRLAKCRVPTCSACLYSKATRRPWRGKTSKSYQEIQAPIRPGHIVSVDQMVSPTPGLIAQMTGFLTTKRYKYATVFVDQYSRYGYVYLQKTATAEETVEGKLAFEAHARRQGVRVDNYHADNGIFKAHYWVEACKRQGQGMTYAGVNAHHQNGIAERRIRELRELARTMLIHANARWKDSVSTNLWPYALRYANEAINHTPSFQDAERRAPVEKFSNAKVTSNPKHWKPFACPVYVLDNDLQGQNPFHKWKHRAKAGVYLGKSPLHGRSVSLVLDRDTALVSPQFHTAFDPNFDNVKDLKSKSNWQIKAGFVIQRELSTQKRRDTAESTATTPRSTIQPSGTKKGQGKKRKRVENESNAQQKNGNPANVQGPAAVNAEGDGLPTTPGTSERATEEVPATTTRSDRKAKPTRRLIEVMTAEIMEATSGNVSGEVFAYASMFPHDDRDDYTNPLLAYKSVSDPDTLYYHEAMREHDKDRFQESMLKELSDQFDNGNFTVVHKSEVPTDQTILPAVWQMKRKRDAKTGSIKKYKARLNIDGSRMKYGVHYHETYSPVASWNSVTRMLLTLTAVHGWHTKQIDFVQAFAQAPVERTLYMKIPAGVEIEGGLNVKDHVLKIHRNIYGQKQAGRVWNKYLVRKLVAKLGFKQSKVDECVFYRGNVLYVLYTDDSLIAEPDPDEIDQVIQELQNKAKLSITVEGDLADFLGVNIERKEDDTIHLSQPHLIDQILEDLRLKDERVKVKATPAATSKLLSRHSDSPSFDNSFNYRSVIGKLNYLEKASRPDISYAVHQCARFAADPEEAATDRDTARSRHGYIISYGGCPLLWKSQMQTEIALSSTESEYTGLSYALRDAIPIIELLKELKENGFPINRSQASIHCRVFEDNSGAIEMSKVHKYRPRTKHLNVRLHHFRDYVERREVSIHAISTHDQPADYLTKALSEDALARHRFTIQGW